MRAFGLLLLAATSVAGAQAATPAITRKLTIGCESCGGPAQFGSIWDVSISAQGEVLVTDRDPPMLRRFDASGKVVWTGGRRGQGPGEFALPVRAALTGQGIVVVDMTNSRVTQLSDAGSVQTIISVTTMPMTAAVNASGDLWVGNDDFRGTLTLYRRVRDTLVLSHKVQGSTANVGIAVGSDGALAIMPSPKKYEILRFDSRGAAQPPLLRDIAQVRRTPEEEQEVRERMNRSRGLVAAEAKAQGGKRSPPVFRPEELSLKDHLVIDGLRFDAKGRVWVRTQRGNERSTIFDVFAPTGALLGSVTVPMKVTSYALGGSYLATAGENGDGIPVVVIWTLTSG
jgi:hypothetical protein